MQLVIASTLLALVAVAYGQECDCEGYIQCKNAAREERKAEIIQCIDSCKQNLQPVLRSAFETCKPAKTSNELREQFKACIMRATCETSDSTENPEQAGTGRRGGKRGGGGKRSGRRSKTEEGGRQGEAGGRGGKGGKRGGKRSGGKRGSSSPLRTLLSQLTEEQQANLKEFKTCAKQCRPTERDETCKDLHPSCTFNREARLEPDSEAAKCTRPERPDKSAHVKEMCTCLVDNLGLTDASICDQVQGARVRGDRQGGGKRRRNKRAVDSNDDDEDSVSGGVSSEEDDSMLFF